MGLDGLTGFLCLFMVDPTALDELDIDRRRIYGIDQDASVIELDDYASVYKRIEGQYQTYVFL